MRRFSFQFCFGSAAALGAVAVGSLALGGCANEIELAFGGCKSGETTLAVGARVAGPCGESCLCTEGGLDCGPSLCPPDPPDPDPIPCMFEGNVVVEPGMSILIESRCETCTCPPGGSADAANVVCASYEKPECMQLPPGCTQITEETCTECPRCTCEPPPMGCAPPAPGCFYPNEGLCEFNNGDYCGVLECPPLCGPSDPVPSLGMDCFVEMTCDPNNGVWTHRSICPCGDLDGFCDMMMPMDPMSCRFEPSCDMQLMTPTCTEVCACADPQMCLYPNVYDLDPLTSCGACRPCATCLELAPPQEPGYVCVDDPMSGCAMMMPM